MKYFEPDRFYVTTDKALGLIATRGTLSQWRHQAQGPTYIKMGNKILYWGRDLNAWMDARRVEPTG